MRQFTLTRTLLWLLVGLLPACTAATSGVEKSATFPGEVRVTESVVDQGRTGIKGQAFLKENGEPVAGAYVNIYPDSFTNLLGPSQFLSRPTDKDGRYQLDMPPGTYYVVARKRISGQPTGPLSRGDFYSEHQRIVTTVTAGRVAVVNLSMVPMNAPMFFKKVVVEKATDTGIKGTIVDQQGQPVFGGFAMAYVDDNLQRLPDFASTLTDENGQFILYLPRGGTFYLAGRVQAWDMPHPGEPYGQYGGETPAPVAVEKGQFVDGLKIILKPFTKAYTPGKSQRPF